MIPRHRSSILRLAGLALAAAAPAAAQQPATGVTGEPASRSPFALVPGNGRPAVACLPGQPCALVQPCRAETGCSAAAEAAVLATLRRAREAAKTDTVDNEDVRLALFYLSRYGFRKEVLDSFWSAAGQQDPAARVMGVDSAYRRIAQLAGQPDG